MRAHLAPGAPILLDDVARAEERAVAARWAESLGTEYEIAGSEHHFASITVPLVT